MKKPKEEKEEIIIEEDTSLPEKLKKLREELKAVGKEKADYLAGWQRERADFVNFKKESSKNLINSIELTKIDILSEFLGVLDSFELAEKSPQWNELPADWQKGMQSIAGQFRKIFEEYNVKEIETSGNFDPSLHEAIGVVENKKDGEDGKIAAVINKGYRLGERILRVAKVKVFKYKHE